MKSLDIVLRLTHRESDARRDHLDIFCEFIDHLGRVSRGRNDKMAASKEKRTKR
jgi:hypothetical protein